MFLVLGRVRILCSVENTQLVGQTCSRDVEEDEVRGQQSQWPQSFLGLPCSGLHSVAVPVDLPLL